MKKLILASLFLILTSCTSTPTPAPIVETAQVESTPTKEAQPTKPLIKKGKAGSCICTKLWMPVCGENKKTYGNACEADCAGVKYTNGACGEAE